MTIEIRSRDRLNELAEACADDWPRLMFDGFGIMVSDEQAEGYIRLGQPGPRKEDEFKYNWLSGGQRSGKTVFGFGTHADACLYKRGIDNTSRMRWNNYAYPTLALAPSDALTLRLWQIGLEISKGAHESQYDSKVRRSRGGAFITKLKAGTDSKGNGLWRWSNGSRTEFRSSEARATRLEGGQWPWITWDEWASQPDREIAFILSSILLGRSRDFDGKIMPMAWPKPETERHLIAVIREIEAGRDLHSQVIYLSARKAFFTNQKALAIELETKTESEIKREIDGEPAGGAMREFKKHVIDNMVVMTLPKQDIPEDQFAYFSSWDLGMANDSTVGFTWRIPIVDGRRIVTPDHKARLVNRIELPGSDIRDIDDITTAVRLNQITYRCQSAMDATSMGGVMAVRQLRNMDPRPHSFTSRSNDRIYGNMRLAAIANGLECCSWGRPEEDDVGIPWGLVEMPYYIETIDQLANFDRDAKDIPDDEVWAFLIGLWYIRRWWVVGEPGIHVQRSFDPRANVEEGIITRRARDMRRSKLIQNQRFSAAAPSGVVFIREGKRYKRG